MKLFVTLLAILGTVYANCGCLKCSKHLTVAGSVPGAPGQAPIQVIYRSENGFPRDTGLVGGAVAAQPTVQAPAPVPEDLPTVSVPGKEIPVEIQQSFRPIDIGCHGNRRIWERNFLNLGGCYMDGIIPADRILNNYDGRVLTSFGNALLDGEVTNVGEGLLSSVGECGILPVEVQIPEELPSITIPSVPIEGLTTSIDRVIVPAPPISVIRGENVIPTCCGPITCPLHSSCGCGPYPAQNFQSFGRKPCCGLSRYESIPSVENTARSQTHKRSKRQSPIVQHGYKFMMNMLPKFIKEPIMKTVNSMALTHPDKKLQVIYNLPPPQQSLQEKITQKHKENIASIKSKIFGKPALKQLSKQYAATNYGNRYGVEEDYYPKKYDSGDRFYSKNQMEGYFSNRYKDYNIPSSTKRYEERIPYAHLTQRLVDEETEHFIDSLHYPKPKTRSQDQILKHKQARYPQLKEKDTFWMGELSSNEILDEYFNQKPVNDGEKMSAREKARFLQKLKKLNNAHKISKRNVNSKVPNSTKNMKRSIIIDSDEFSLPLYQIRIRDSDEDNEIDKDYDYEEDYIVSSHYKDISKEELLRKAIREELQRFREDNSEEELEFAPHIKKEWISKYPLLHLLTLPAKVLRSLNDEDSFPIVKAVPKMLVGTKRYFRDFGRNFKKNLLHFTSDMIGDFEEYTPTDNFLDNIINRRRRFRRDLPEIIKNSTNQSQTQTTNKDGNISDRKKRYILKMVDDDEIEQLLREKLGRMIEEPEKPNKSNRKFRAKHNKIGNSEEERKIIEHLFGGMKKQSRSSSENYFDNPKKQRNNSRLRSKKITSQEDSIEQIRKKIIIEPVKPKLIIDNHGLPFMEVNGYKRPIFMKKAKKKETEENSVENTSFDPYNSSEEGDLDKINSIINRARDTNYLPSRNAEIPVQAIKEKISQLLTDIDVLIYMDCRKFDDIYDELNEIQSIKKSIVQSWKRLIMDKQTNDYEAKIGILEKFTELQETKNRAMRIIIQTLYEERENAFAVKKLIGDLVSLQKIQCIINQVVDSFQEKFKTGTKFDVVLEIKYVDFLSSLKVLKANTRNEMIRLLENERDIELQENIQLLEKLKRLLVDDDDDLIEEEANILWDIKHVQSMQVSTIEEIIDRLEKGLKIKKCLKILFDLQRRLAIMDDKEKKVGTDDNQAESDSGEESDEISVSGESQEEHDEVDITSDKNKSKKKFNLEEFKRKWQEKVVKHKHLIEENYKKKIDKLKELRKILKSSEEKV
ncbi:uncharacterized protein LOC130895145 [Diorhabda carinulata]|uniref:uncharacterized protein LOC130895145 n=1 Tax=Diorhabda carinulata TaxID=1163345 RepID=UPI0025A10848|nr:uncharacterized protein LOC130895145 [Diorhabda carinulata]